jgi:ubiquitin carboxyl-terminal hydrolase 4/11/15
LGKNLDLEDGNIFEGKVFCEIEVVFKSSTSLNVGKLASSTPADGGASLERNKDSLSLTSCFEAFEQPEILDEMNTWFCRKCKDHVRAKKEMKVFKVPDVLIIQLKRFKEREHTIHGYYKDYHTSVGSKITTLVDFPLEGLDLENLVMSKENIEEDYKLTFDEIYGEEKKKETKEEEKMELENESSPSSKMMEEPESTAGEAASCKRRLIYDLYAVSNHYGSMNFGHYTAYVKNPFTKAWYDCDDSRVGEVNPSRVVSEAAYVLFYRRRKEN